MLVIFTVTLWTFEMMAQVSCTREEVRKTDRDRELDGESRLKGESWSGEPSLAAMWHITIADVDIEPRP